MRAVAIIILAFAFLSWDMGRNHGRFTYALHASLNDMARVAGIP